MAGLTELEYYLCRYVDYVHKSMVEMEFRLNSDEQLLDVTETVVP